LFAPHIQREANARAAESSFVRKRRGKAKQELKVKIGHGGTLDPLASGVLILGIGKGTKSLGNFLHCTKTYEAIVLFGASTDTYDRAGRVLKRRSYEEVTRGRIEGALEEFRGKYKQMPPLYSALKMNGKPLYEYAREGKPLPREIETRDVEVSSLELVEWYDPGDHNHRWPTDEAGSAEQNLAERVWRMGKHQAAGKKLSPEAEKNDIEALAAHEAFKRKADERTDDLVFDRPSKRRMVDSSPPMMSGALGSLPQSSPYHDENGRHRGKGSNLVPPAPEPSTPPPWEGKGPPAVKLRMTVSSGFYVRVLCHELGEKIGSAAIMCELVRTRQGDFTLGTSNCLEYDDLAKGEAVWAPKVSNMLRRWNDPDATEDEGPAPSTSEAVLSPPAEMISPTKGVEDNAAGEELPIPAEKSKDHDREYKGADTPIAATASAESILPTPREDESKSVADSSEFNGFSDPQVSEATSSTPS
jgi:tRNA pseudouridine55 synthase